MVRKGRGSNGASVSRTPIPRIFTWPTLDDWSLTEDEWAQKIEELEVFFDASDDSAILAWFDEHTPRIMALVPARRRGQLLAGMYARVAEGGDVFAF
jgi:hypothetical protein